MIDQPSQRPSGLAWAPVVPAHWTVKKLAFLASLKSGESITTDDIKDDGPYPVYGGSVAYCMRRFKSYDPVSMTYLGYDGYRHPCP